MKQTLRNQAARPNDSLVIHFLTLRAVIGMMGIALPFVLVIGENLRDRFAAHTMPRVDRHIVEVSISAYFHTGMRDVYVGTLTAIAVFLICYKGYQRIDNLVANAAGVCALLVAFFPTPEESREATDAGSPIRDSITLFSGPYAPDPQVVGWIHFASAAVFLVLLATMSLFLFTKSDPAAGPNPWKDQRNFIYRLCGVTILLCVVSILLAKFMLSESAERASSLVFWFEAIAVVVFGVSLAHQGGGVPEGSTVPSPAPPDPGCTHGGGMKRGWTGMERTTATALPSASGEGPRSAPAIIGRVRSSGSRSRLRC